MKLTILYFNSGVLYGSVNIFTHFSLFSETSSVRCGVETNGGNGENFCCVFPFNYRGVDYFRCTTTDAEEPWCSVTRNYDRDGLWGNCVGM